ncbi:MAG: leucyl aminopeptidase [Pseudomonadota bacterium]
MKFHLAKQNLNQTKADLIVVGIFEEKPSLLKEDQGQTVDRSLKGEIGKLIIKEEFKAHLGDKKLIFTAGLLPARYVLLLGLGKKNELNLDSLRKIGGAIAKAAQEIKAKSLAVVFQKTELGKLKTPERIQAFAEGLLLGLYSFDQYKKKEEREKQKLEEVFLIASLPEKQFDDLIQQAKIVAQATNLARDLGNMPSVDLTPQILANIAKEIATKYHLKCEVFNLAKIKAEKMGAFLAVTKGSEEPPAFIHLQYRPKQKPKKKVAIVGKGITFDSGGISIKPAKGMEEMKDDMCGAGTTLAVMQAIAQLKPKVAVDAYIPACENMPSGKAIKPGDIVTARNGKTIEIITTDAEGRMILADALSYAADNKPDYMIDLATLTGHCAYAIGERYMAILGNDQTLVDKLMAGGKTAGEKMWQFPLEQEYKKGMTKGIADLRNTGTSKAGVIEGALFLEEFVGKSKWAHLDIASVAVTAEDLPYTPKGCAGAGVRLLIKFLLSL